MLGVLGCKFGWYSIIFCDRVFIGKGRDGGNEMGYILWMCLVVIFMGYLLKWYVVIFGIFLSIVLFFKKRIIIFVFKLLWVLKWKMFSIVFGVSKDGW